MEFFDIIFPKKCVSCRTFGDYICERCFSTISFDTKVICVVCNRNTFDGKTHNKCRGRYTIDGVFSGVVFSQGVRKIIYAFKYQPYVSDIGKSMTDLLYESLIQQEQFYSVVSSEPPLFIPIPLSKKRLQKRGYNHAKILADLLAKKFDGRVVACLERVKETRPQFGLKREERIKNIQGAFGLKKPVIKSLPEQIFLIDDVLTTGSTLAEAAKILKQSGVKNVWGVTFAREQNFDI